MRRALLTMIAAVAMVLAFAGPSAAQYPPAPPALTVSDTIVVPGEAIVVSGTGWLPDSIVTFTLFSDPVELGTAQVAADTSFSAELEIPSSVAPGTHTLRVSGTGANGEPRVEELTIEVVASAAGRAALATTGGELTVGVGLAAALVVAGGVALVVARRRRNRVVIEQ